jgi:hypothetical protein
MTTVALLHRDPVLGLRLAETIAAAPGLTVSGVAAGCRHCASSSRGSSPTCCSSISCCRPCT